MFGERLDSEEWKRAVFRIAKQIAKGRCDVTGGVSCLKDEVGQIVVDPYGIKGRWKRYMERLLDVENEWDGNIESNAILGPAEKITEKEVEEARRAMISRKAGGLMEVVGMD